MQVDKDKVYTKFLLYLSFWHVLKDTGEVDIMIWGIEDRLLNLWDLFLRESGHGVHHYYNESKTVLYLQQDGNIMGSICCKTY